MKLHPPARIWLSVLTLYGCTALAGPLTLPAERWPAWVHEDGIVMAGSWEALPFRIRRDSDQQAPTPEQQAAWDREHSPEMVRRLESLGVNFVMSHCYKGAGLDTERESMADAVRFAKLCHQEGLKVGVYTYSGAFLWEPFFREVPRARDWLLLDESAKPLLYGPRRYYWNRNHPEAVAFYRQLVRFAVEEIEADLIHLDNYHESAGFDARSVGDFRRYLRETFSAAELDQAGIDVDHAIPPGGKAPASLLTFAWRDFQCDYLARSYFEMGRYARSLRADILMECNPMSVPRFTRPPVDHARILPGGEASWDESYASGLKEGKLTTRIRTYKVCRLMNNMAFSYITSPLEAAEAMAFNHPDCLGCICWFEYGEIVAKPGSTEPPDPRLQPFIRFFHARRDLVRGAEVVADVAVLRSFSSQVFAEARHRELTAAVEDELIARRVPFQIVYDQHLADLDRWPVLVLAGCVAMSDVELEQTASYVRAGGKVVIVGAAATHDRWMRPRTTDPFEALPAGAVLRVARSDEVPAAVARLRGEPCSLVVDTAAPVCAELTRRPGRLLVHLVNYDRAHPAENLRISLAIPPGRTVARVLAADPERESDRKLSFRQDGGRVRLELPALSTYVILDLRFD